MKTSSLKINRIFSIITLVVLLFAYNTVQAEEEAPCQKCDLKVEDEFLIFQKVIKINYTVETAIIHHNHLYRETNFVEFYLNKGSDNEKKVEIKNIYRAAAQDFRFEKEYAIQFDISEEFAGQPLTLTVLEYENVNGVKKGVKYKTEKRITLYYI